MKVTVIIPSYCPPPSLVSLCEALKNLGLTRVIVVNDGSPHAFDPIFSATKSIGVEVIALKSNSGKGAALREGIVFGLKAHEDSTHLVFCDDDGQHAPEDVVAVASTAFNSQAPFVLGHRTFGKETPWKSWIGNRFMSALVRLRHGLECSDTQSGLRCFSRSVAYRISSERIERFGFELFTLVKLFEEGIHPIEVPIRTLYFNHNGASRFRVLRDSLHVISTAFSVTATSKTRTK